MLTVPHDQIEHTVLCFVKPVLDLIRTVFSGWNLTSVFCRRPVHDDG